MKWELIRPEKQNWTQDESGLYTIINYSENAATMQNTGVRGDGVRVDVMTTKHEPVISFQGVGQDVRIALMRWLSDNIKNNNEIVSVSLEHAAYIGSEIAKAELLKEKYIQD